MLSPQQLMPSLHLLLEMLRTRDGKLIRASLLSNSGPSMSALTIRSLEPLQLTSSSSSLNSLLGRF